MSEQLLSLLTGLLPDKSTLKVACILAAPVYLICVRYFRNYRRRKLEKRFEHLFDKDGKIKPDAKLNPLDAQEIVWSIGHYDFPFSFTKAMEFALFKTYGIPAISKLLCETDQLVGDQAARRGEDTAVIFTEFISRPLDSERCRLAIARMNWMHAKYGKKISSDTLMYTWAAICVETSEWIRRFEWRPLTPLEEFGQYIFWREIGTRMGIPSSIVPSTYEELVAWYRQYENDHMVFTESSQAAGEGTVGLMLASIRFKSLRPHARKVIIACLETHLRVAMGFEEAPPIYLELILGFCTIRNFIIKHLTLPRYYMNPPTITDTPNSMGKYNRTVYNFKPFYIPTTPKYYLQGIFTGLMPSEEKYRASGFIVEEDIGPEYFRGKGLKEIREAAAGFPTSDKGTRMKCPYSF